MCVAQQACVCVCVQIMRYLCLSASYVRSLSQHVCACVRVGYSLTTGVYARLPNEHNFVCVCLLHFVSLPLCLSLYINICVFEPEHLFSVCMSRNDPDSLYVF